MPTPGDLCQLADLKSYIGGATPADPGNDAVLSALITSASAFIARYLDRDLMSLGGQGNSSIATVGADAGGAFITLSSPLPAIPVVGAVVIEMATASSAFVAAPGAAMANTASKLYLSSTAAFVAQDPVFVLMLQTYSEIYDGSGKSAQWLRQWPIASLLAVTDIPSRQSYSLNLIVPDADLPRIMFQTSNANSPGLLLANGAALGLSFAQGVQNLQVTYTAGYPTVPFDLAQAAIELALLWFKNRDRIGISAESLLGTHVNFFSTSDLLPQTRLKLAPFKRTLRGF